MSFQEIEAAQFSPVTESENSTGRRTKSGRMDTRHRSGHFGAALAYATKLHAGQVRKDKSIPYIAHLLGVASQKVRAQQPARRNETVNVAMHRNVESCCHHPSVETAAETLRIPQSRIRATGEAWISKE